ncbi:hypothetical protein BDZ45DRAFT_799213 [Acephala macrosclerotiorum]|nr:hypothetical protein BDZ45DRAFT_799213 [Acephala macrosclerotiorum]
MCVDTEYRWENCRAVEIHHLVCISHIRHTRLQIDNKPCPFFRVEEMNYKNTPSVSICQCKIYRQPCIRNVKGLPGDKNEHWEFEYDESAGSWPNYQAGKGKEPEAVGENKNADRSPVKNPAKRHKGLSRDDEDMVMDASDSGSVKREKADKELEEEMKGVPGFYNKGILQTGDEMEGIR